MEIKVDVKGVSCHGSAPERGDNAIYKMADILQDVRALNNNGDTESTAIRGLVRMLDPKYNPEWQEARFLGRGTVTVFANFPFFTKSVCCCGWLYRFTRPSNDCWRNLGKLFRKKFAIYQLLKIWNDVTVSMYNYDRPSYRI